MESNQHKLIITIVGKGKHGRVVDIAHKAGAPGGTVLTGHGAAVRLFPGIHIDPEKEIILTVVGADKVERVLKAISDEMELDSPNKGLAFVLPLDYVAGISQDLDIEDY